MKNVGFMPSALL